ncbi:MAG: PAS domain-containing protein, partial [Thiomicrorhabdus sp.]|nr:PAS domain-containing protein [Thiomicrorhabdus sp.]
LNSLKERKKHFAYIRFNQASFAHVKPNQPLQEHESCVRPYEVSENIGEIMGVQVQKLIDGEHCFREFLHPDDFDIVQKFAAMGCLLPELSEQYSEQTLLWQSSIRVLNIVSDAKIIHLDVYFVPAENSGSIGTIKLELFDKQNDPRVFGDALMVYNFHAMLENTNDLICFKDRYHFYTAASKTLVGLTNLKDRSELVGKTDYDVFSKEYADKYFAVEKRILSGEVPFTQEIMPIRDKEGNEGWVDSRKYPIRDQDGKIIGLFGIAREVSEEELQSAKDVASTEQ